MVFPFYLHHSTSYLHHSTYIILSILPTSFYYDIYSTTDSYYHSYLYSRSSYVNLCYFSLIDSYRIMGESGMIYAFNRWNTVKKPNHQFYSFKRRRHKLLESRGDPPIFRRFLFWGIGRWSPDFFDLEPGRKSQAPDVCRPPPGDCSVAARFTLRITEISADAPTAIGRSSSGDCRGTCRSPSDVKKSGDHRKIAVRASCGHRGIR